MQKNDAKKESMCYDKIHMVISIVNIALYERADIEEQSYL